MTGKPNAIDRIISWVAPQWGARRIAARMLIGGATQDGYVVPGSRKKSMKGVTATANSPTRDIAPKLDGMRALSRDLFMNSSLAASIIRRHKVLTIGGGLQFQSTVDADFLGLSIEAAEAKERDIERVFDFVAESRNIDFAGAYTFAEMQAVAYVTLLLSGDFFWMPVWREPKESGFPFEFCVRLIDADLVRNPRYDAGYSDRDIVNGVEVDAQGNVVAYHVWNAYQDEYTGPGGETATSTRVPVFDRFGRRQIFHVYDPERINQRRGVPKLANAADTLKQLSRLTDAQLMNALVSSFFTVFVRDTSGYGAMLGTTMTPQESVIGSGRYSPNDPATAPYAEDGNDVELGHGNVVYVDENKDISIADPRKTDANAPAFWKFVGAQACAAADIPIEQALMHYETSYTAARAAANDVWRYRKAAREIMRRGFLQPVLEGVIEEAVIKGRLALPGFLDDAFVRRAWTRGEWVGSGPGSINPLQEAKASALEIDYFLTTREAEYAARHDGRWDAAMRKRAREHAKLEQVGEEQSAYREQI